MHRLKSTSTEVKKECPQFGLNTDHNGPLQQSYWQANELIAIQYYRYLWISIDNIILNELSSPNF